MQLNLNGSYNINFTDFYYEKLEEQQENKGICFDLKASYFYCYSAQITKLIWF